MLREWGRVGRVRVMFEYVAFQFILISEEFEALLVMVIGQSGVQFREYFQIGQAICNYESNYS